MVLCTGFYDDETGTPMERPRELDGKTLEDITPQELEKIVNEVGKTEKFTLILERSQILYSDQGIDITNRVIEAFNARSKSK